MFVLLLLLICEHFEGCVNAHNYFLSFPRGVICGSSLSPASQAVLASYTYLLNVETVFLARSP
jgi:hypothetical protein